MQQNNWVFRCKAKCEDADRGKLTLCFESGENVEQELLLDGSESEWPDDGHRTIVCAYVSAAGRLLLATDERGKRAFERDRDRDEREAQRAARAQTAIAVREEPIRGKPAGKASDAAEKRQTHGNKLPKKECEATASFSDVERRLPEGRWPPPPCWPKARYRGGRWTETEETAEGREA